MPNKVVFVDVGIDLDVPEIKAANVKLKTPNNEDQTHGTAVVGVYSLTLQSLLKNYYQKEIDIKDYVAIDFYSVTSNQNFMEVLKEDLPQCRSINISATCRHPNYEYPKNNNVFDDIHTQLKRIHQSNIVVFAAAANHSIFSTSDIVPQNDPHVYVVGAYYTKDYQVPEDTVPLYVGGLSTPGSAVWFCASGAQITYNTVSCEAYYTDNIFFIFNFSGKTTERSIVPRKKMIRISGTSFAAPYATALNDFVAIIRPDLDARNVFRLLIEATEKFDPSPLNSEWWDTKVQQQVRQFNQNKAKGRNGEGRFYSQEFGYGKINETKLMHLVQTWENKDIEEIEFYLIPTEEIFDQGQYVYVYDCPLDYDVFNVHLTFKSYQAVNAIHNLSITSPLQTESFVYHPDFSPQYWNEKVVGSWFFAMMTDSYLTKLYLTNPINNRATDVHFYGEPTKGQWRVKTNVKLTEAQITFRATRQIDDVYWYDNDIFKVERPSVLEDLDEGFDTIDLSGYQLGEVEVNFNHPRGITFTAGDKSKFVPIGCGTFEKVVFGPLGGKRVG